MKGIANEVIGRQQLEMGRLSRENEKLRAEVNRLTDVCGDISDKAASIIRTCPDVTELWVGWLNEISGIAFRAWKSVRCPDKSGGGK